MIQFYKISIVLSILWLSFGPAYQHNQTKICNVTCYYETFCMMSRVLLTKQIPEAYKALGDSLVIDFVPFGSAQTTKKNGKWNFTCQHGLQECIGNRIQACVIYALKNKTAAQIKVLSNFMSVSPPLSKNYSQYFLIEDKEKKKLFADCMNSDKGNELLAAYGDQTSRASPLGLPFLVVNGNSSYAMSQDARQNLEKTCCILLGIQMPKQCKRDCDKNTTSS